MSDPPPFPIPPISHYGCHHLSPYDLSNDIFGALRIFGKERNKLVQAHQSQVFQLEINQQVFCQGLNCKIDVQKVIKSHEMLFVLSQTRDKLHHIDGK
jgi:hypothetical protein